MLDGRRITRSLGFNWAAILRSRKHGRFGAIPELVVGFNWAAILRSRKLQQNAQASLELPMLQLGRDP